MARVLFLSMLYGLALAKPNPLAPVKPVNPTLAKHYYDYLRSPAVVVVAFILLGPLLYGMIRKLRQGDPSRPQRNFDCFRLGITKRSNLVYQTPEQTSRTSDHPIVQALFTYPVKSCRGVELAASEVGTTGLKYDRTFTFAQLVTKNANDEDLKESDTSKVFEQQRHEWKFITQREFPKLALLETELWVPHPSRRRQRMSSASEKSKSSDSRHGRTTLQWESHEPRSTLASNGGCVVIRFPSAPDFNPFGLRTEIVTIRIPLAPISKRVQAKRYTVEPLSIWVDTASAINVSNEIASGHLSKLKAFLGVSNPLGLFRVDDRNRRKIIRSLPEDRPGESYPVGFGDAFPLHLLSLASINMVNKDLPGKNRLDPLRFRANIYVSNTPAYEEDSWKRIRAGRCVKMHGSREKIEEADGDYHVACRTARCTMPNVDQETGLKDKNEPYTTMSKTRKIDKGAYPYPCLGMQMIPLFQQGLLKVGDEIRVTETGEHYYEKML